MSTDKNYDQLENGDYDIDNQSKNTIHNKFNYRKIFIPCIIICIILSLIYYNIYIQNELNINVDKQNLYSSLRFHHNHHKTCDDLKFGCCKITDNYNKEYILSLHRIDKININGTNCPSYNTLLTLYKHYIYEYYNFENCTKIQCCNINKIELPLSYCPTTFDIIVAYNNNYQNPNDIGLIILLLLFSCLFCKTSLNR